MLKLLCLFYTFGLLEACLGVLGNGRRNLGRGLHEGGFVLYLWWDSYYNLL